MKCKDKEQNFQIYKHCYTFLSLYKFVKWNFLSENNVNTDITSPVSAMLLS